MELLLRSRPRTIGEVPYVFVGRSSGESKMGAREALRYLGQLVELLAFAVRTGFARPTRIVVPPAISPETATVPMTGSAQ